MQKHRISTNIGVDNKVIVELKQDYDLLEILSLKFTQSDVYSSMCSDYGVVCGRISVNNGFGVPNVRVSIFIPIQDEDVNDPVISSLYPFTTVDDRNEEGYRYNLLPSRQQHGGHVPTGTFPDQKDILTREEVLEVYEKYYKYTAKTNESGDFMIWGVPVGSQVLHIDADLSDIGCFSLRPDDFIRQGIGEDNFENSYQYKSSTDIDTLPQIVSFNQNIEVYPFWGNEDLCEIGITRSDFDMSSRGIRIEPKAYFIGGTFTDSGKSSINKNCVPRSKMGRKCDLTTRTGRIETIRFTNNKDELNRPILEYVNINEEIDEDGSFIVPVEMNMDYIYTNEFGENEYTNDPNKGIPTSGCYRFRLSLSDDGLSRVRANGDYLVPNIREYVNQSGGIDDRSYSFSTNFDDYPDHAVNNYILNNEDGFYYPRDYFYRLNYNKVYTVSSFQGSYFSSTLFTRDRFLGLKELVPAEEEDCSGNAVTPPVNFGFRNYTFQLLVSDVLLFFEHLINLFTFLLTNTLAKILHRLANAIDTRPIRFLSTIVRGYAYTFQNSTQRELYLINYPECEECNNENQFGTPQPDPILLDYCKVGTITISGSTNEDVRTLSTLNDIYFSGSTYDPPTCSGSTLLWDTDQCNSAENFVNNQTNYVIFFESNGERKVIELTPPLTDTDTGFLLTKQLDGLGNCTGYTLNFVDPNNTFNTDTGYSCFIGDKNEVENPQDPLTPNESGCDLYDVPYDDGIIHTYYVGDNRVKYPAGTLPPGADVVSTRISDNDGYGLVKSYDGETYEPIRPADTNNRAYSEFSNGIFYYIPGTQSSGRVYNILKEYRRRKRVGTMFCGGIVNYSFIDNWLSGSLYFFQFKAKVRWDNEANLDLSFANTNYCEDLVYYKIKETVTEEPVKKFYYRSTKTDTNGTFVGVGIENKKIGHPTTMVDLGPRDEFIKEICTDPSLDPNCSVVRSIGPTSFQNFGEMLGLIINYRMDTESDNNFELNEFFDNQGFENVGFTNRVLDGDILQLISINNEVGIEEFDLQNPKYLGYSYQVLDPETYPNIFKNGTSVWGPTPITLELDDDGQRVRLCLNEPGRLTEASQTVPFYLWDKKGTGFGAYDDAKKDDQSWSYSAITAQPLQGMTYGYMLSGGTNDPSDKYLLLPMTYTNNGQVITGTNVTSAIEFNVIDVSGTDNHTLYDSQYPGFTYLYVTGFTGTPPAPASGLLYIRYGDAGTWDTISWNTNVDFIIKKTEDYYSGDKQILSTPFQFYFGLRPGNTGVDKFIARFGPAGAFPSAE